MNWLVQKVDLEWPWWAGFWVRLQAAPGDAENVRIRAQGRTHPKMPLNYGLDYAGPLSVTSGYCCL